MKNSILLLLIVAVLISCNKEIETRHIIEINNYSSSKIQIPRPDDGNNGNVIILQPNKSYNYNFIERGNQLKLSGRIHGLRNDSVKLVYNDTITIYHGSNQYNVAKDIRMVNSYKYEEVGNDHNYTFNFTNEDFREADSLIN